VVNNIKDETVQGEEVYINVMEDELVVVLEKLVKSGLTIGKEVGVISYNETPVKKFILNGITTISTDFHQMGITAAQLILANSKDHTEIPFKLTLRASL
jgi:DNA-binding LacI/PurR family transcriptional regulator